MNRVKNIKSWQIFKSMFLQFYGSFNFITPTATVESLYLSGVL